MKPHKHKDVIIAWANGAVIQCKWCEAAPWSNVNNNAPIWSEDIEYRASLAEIEGRPVFEGDELYGTETGEKFIASEYLGGLCNSYGLQKLSWNPPKPKTVTVELLREDVEFFSTSELFSHHSVNLKNACKEALK
jgi:hypothetical protein